MTQSRRRIFGEGGISVVLPAASPDKEGICYQIV